MTVNVPSAHQLRAVADEFGLEITDAELAEFRELMTPNVAMLNWVESQQDVVPEVRHPRTPGYEPEGEDNELNAWARKTAIRGAPSGRLAGRRIAIKDNVAVAGVPMANGSSTLTFYTPEFDATVVTRILDAGGEIAGKAHCEFFSFTGNSHSNWKLKKVQNPHRAGRTSGGSSSGCGALVGGGVVDLAIGGDQGGSIRIPSSWCGCYGMKPTYGLVPYTGAAPIEMTIDHLGPMTTSVADNALLLEVIAGADGLDPRQREVRVDTYTAALGRDLRGLRIGVLKEGFAHPNSEPGVDAKVRAAAERFRGLGATVVDVSVPEHLDTVQTWFPIACQGATELMMNGNGVGSNWLGFYPVSLADAQHMWRLRQHELSEMVKFVVLLGGYMKKYYRGQPYAKAQNVRRRLTQNYDRVFESVDLLLFPTTPFTAPAIPDPGCSRAAYLEASGGMVNNTVAANLTHHPAMNVPCGMLDGLPVGLTLVARHWHESVIYRAAHAFEQHDDWRSL